MWLLNRKTTKEDKAQNHAVATCTKRSEEINELQAMANSLIVADRTILYDRIKYSAKSYITRGWISVEKCEDPKRTHKVYHDGLKGNGFLDTLMAEVDQLEKRDL